MKRLIEHIQSNQEYRDTALVLFIIISIFLSFRYCLPIILPFVLALFIAGCLRPIVDFITSRVPISEKLCSILVLLSIAGILICFCKWGIQSLLNQLESLLLYLPFYKERFLCSLGTCCSFVDTELHLDSGASLTFANDTFNNIFSDTKPTLIKAFTTSTSAAVKFIFAALLFIFIMLYATFCMLVRYPRLFTQGSLAKRAGNVWSRLTEIFVIYLRAEGTIALLQTLICSIVLRILQDPYYLIIGLLIGIMDALPVFGSGTILVPWAIFQLLFGNIKMTVGLLILWGICSLNRQLIEPRLLGQKLGMSTLLTLFMMYIGYQLFGIPGFILGPIGYILGKEIYHAIKASGQSD